MNLGLRHVAACLMALAILFTHSFAAAVPVTAVDTTDVPVIPAEQAKESYWNWTVGFVTAVLVIGAGLYIAVLLSESSGGGDAVVSDTTTVEIR